MSAQTTFSEMLDSLTGHEEAVIEQAFGLEPMALLKASATKSSRGLILVANMRTGADYDSARRQAMGMTIKELGDYWADDPDEVFPEEPETEVGKDSSAPA